MYHKYSPFTKFNTQKFNQLIDSIDNLPREKYNTLPTPLQFLSNLTKELGGPRIYIKRDDLTGMSIGGNKTRKLEFIIADAIQKNATDIITQGATQTNHGSQTSTIASVFGFKSHLLLENRRDNHDDEYLHSGNILLSKILDTKLYYFDKGTNMNREMGRLADQLRSTGARPYIIPGGASNPLGSMGYVNCALELIHQANANNMKIDTIITATGSSGTQSGLVTALKIIESPVKVLGIGTNVGTTHQQNKILTLSREIMNFLDANILIQQEDIRVNCDYIGTGYGDPTDKCLEAIKMVAKLEGIFLDPTYTGKAMAGLIDLIRKGVYTKDQTIVFLHTGGHSSLWGYNKYFK